jgi:orotate phosphoribosyltransferase
MRSNVREKLIERFQQLEIIQYKQVVLRGGDTSSFYCNVKKAYGYPDVLDLLVEMFNDHIKNVTCVAGSGYGGIPIATSLSIRYKLKLTLIRSNQKGYGLQDNICGYIPTKGDKIMIVDDVLTTGSSIKESINVLSTTKANISKTVVVLKRNDVELSVPAYSLLSYKDGVLS